MRHGVLPAVFLLSVLNQVAFAQVPDDGSASKWVVSETTSPVDYSPQISATTYSNSSPGNPPMSLAMHCRRGRTEVVVGVADFARYPAGASIMLDYVVVSQEALKSHWVERRWMQRRGMEQRWNEVSKSAEISLSGDAISFLQALPDGGMMLLRVPDRQGVSHDAEFHLAGLEPIRERLAAACNWPGSSGGVRR